MFKPCDFSSFTYTSYYSSGTTVGLVSNVCSIFGLALGFSLTFEQKDKSLTWVSEHWLDVETLNI